MDSLDILKLSELLNPEQNDCSSDSEDESQSVPKSYVKPGDLGSKTEEKKKKVNVYDKIPENNRLDKNIDVFDPDFDEKAYHKDNQGLLEDWRKAPEWEVSYKQQVTTSDVFLQMTGKSTSTASCEDMILTIRLPGENHHSIDLKINQNDISLVSSKYKLEVPLPQPVNPKLGNAKFDKESEKLVVTLRMEREFDYVNF